VLAGEAGGVGAVIEESTLEGEGKVEGGDAVIFADNKAEAVGEGVGGDGI